MYSTICSWKLTCSRHVTYRYTVLTTLREQFFFGREISFSAVVYHELWAVLITRVGSTEPTSADDEVKAFSSARRRQLARVKRLEKVGNFMSAEVRSLSRQSSRIRGSNRNATNYQRPIICLLIEREGCVNTLRKIAWIKAYVIFQSSFGQMEFPFLILKRTENFVLSRINVHLQFF